MHNFKITEYTDSSLSWFFSVPSGKDRNRAFSQVPVTFFHMLKNPRFIIIRMSDELLIVLLKKMQIGLSIK